MLCSLVCGGVYIWVPYGVDDLVAGVVRCGKRVDIGVLGKGEESLSRGSN